MVLFVLFVLVVVRGGVVLVVIGGVVCYVIICYSRSIFVLCCWCVVVLFRV